MPTKLYFAYGSNLNKKDLRAWCQRNGYRAETLKFHSRAFLPDFDLAFTFRSSSRNGGVLDLQERPGQLVPGVLFEVATDGWEALDAKEGAPSAYQRVEVTVIDDRGNTHIAYTYRVNPRKREAYVAPAPDYVAIVKQGLKHWDLPDDVLDAAVAGRKSLCPDGFFFYGTLMRGENRFAVLQQFGIDCVLLAKAFGRLINLGSFPGLVDVTTELSMVNGEFFRLREPEDALKCLDAIEGFRGFGKSGSLYRRTRIRVDVGDGRIREAWTYCLESGTDHSEPIPSGDWREHRGTRHEFLRRLADIHSGGTEKIIAAKIATDFPFCLSNDPEHAARSLLPLSHSLANGLISERKLAQASGLWNATP